ncbi:MAG: TROVE domain-containing protein [Bacteroidetes bacterium]|nr:TROVE domain-containing protein [Bacteroidota bacterium]
MRFNIIKRKQATLTNYEGEVAYAMRPELELYTAVVTSTLSDTFYESGSDRMVRLRELVAACDPVFVAKLAIYARTKMHLRSVPVYLACLLAQKATGTALVSKTIERIVLRADEITELLACYAIVNDRTDVKKLGQLSKQVQKGLAASFNRFDAYQFAKYDRKTSVSLRDALFLVHPKAKDEAQQVIFDAIVNGTLETPYTWETELSAVGQRSFANEAERTAAITATWESLIESGGLGYMAMLRNLRNILAANVSSSHIAMVCAKLSDSESVARSKQFPLRFLSAYRQLLQETSLDTGRTLLQRLLKWGDVRNGHVGLVLDALERAVTASVSNITGFGAETRVLIACDVSGSMQMPISARSTVMYYDIGLMLGMLLRSKCACSEVGMFGDTWKTIHVPATSILANVQTFYKREGEVGYATNGYLVILDLIQRNVEMDKVMIFTDCQLWNSNGDGGRLQELWTEYKRTIAPGARLYLFDLAGLGQSPLSLMQNDVYLIAGWNERIFEILAAIENGCTAIDAIDRIDV